MKRFKQYLSEDGHWQMLRRQIEQQAGVAPFSREASEIWSDFVSTMSDADFIDMVRWQNETGIIIVPDEFLPRIRRLRAETDALIAIANSSARSPSQRAKLIRNIARRLGRNRFTLPLAGLLGILGAQSSATQSGSASTTPLNP